MHPVGKKYQTEKNKKLIGSKPLAFLLCH